MNRPKPRPPLSEEQRDLVAENAAILDDVVRIGRWRYGWPRRLRHDELRSVAATGLILAAQTFDAARGVPFAAYARFKSMAAIREFLRAGARVPDISVATTARHDAPPHVRLDVHGALAFLSPRQREAVQLRYIDGLGYPEVRARMGIADGTIGQHVKLAFAVLRERLGVYARSA